MMAAFTLDATTIDATGGPLTVPFGKYRGMPVQALLSDPGYVQWCQGNGVLQKYPAIYQTVVINKLADAQETPEHNRLQALFLDDDIWVRIARLISPEVSDVPGDARKNALQSIRLKREQLELKIQRGKESIESFGSGLDPYAQYYLKEVARARESIPNWESDIAALDLATIPEPTIKSSVSERAFESDGYDVKALVKFEGTCRKPLGLSSDGYDGSAEHRVRIGIECKPSLGDDYPAALRQIIAAGGKAYRTQSVLVAGQYTGQGASIDQVRQIFRESGAHLILLPEVLA